MPRETELPLIDQIIRPLAPARPRASSGTMNTRSATALPPAVEASVVTGGAVLSRRELVLLRSVLRVDPGLHVRPEQASMS
jgi:hypothetical protein